jgi:hypothetical protein
MEETHRFIQKQRIRIHSLHIRSQLTATSTARRQLLHMARILDRHVRRYIPHRNTITMFPTNRKPQHIHHSDSQTPH